MKFSPPWLKNRPSLSDFLWDTWCITSIVGIWPRFIEPNLIAISRHTIKIPNLPEKLCGLRLVHFSDLHFSRGMSTRFLQKITRKIRACAPDLIVFTGDFLCYSKLEDKDRLKTFLNTLHAPLGCFAICGNHDYARYVSINSRGEYDVMHDSNSAIGKGFKRLFSNVTLKKVVTAEARAVTQHQELQELLRETPFVLLHNDSKQISCNGTSFNMVGLGEYILSKTNPAEAFRSANPDCPTIVMLHNPDGLHLLQEYRADLVLCGHTHGGQVNLPWMWKKFTLLENERFKSGFMQYNDKWVCINRGIGSTMCFRWFAMPEISLITFNAQECS